MAVAEHEDTHQGSGSGSSARNTALMAAAAAAATSAATIVVRKAMSHEGGGGGGSQRREGDRGDGRSLLASAGSSAWEAASDALLPVAEDAADAAGRYLAEHAPDVVRERIVPRFIEAFNNAS